MSAMGGVIGILLAWILAVILDKTTPLPMSVPLPAVVVAICVSTAVDYSSASIPRARQQN